MWKRIWIPAALFFIVFSLVLIAMYKANFNSSSVSSLGKDSENPTPSSSIMEKPIRKTGLILNGFPSFQGYTLITPMNSQNTYLIDNDSRIVHRWKSAYPGLCAYLLPNGRLLRAAMSDTEGKRPFPAGGLSGRVQEFAWDGTLMWDFEYSTADTILHHGIEPLPNGNILMIAWERIRAEEAVAAGRSPATLGDAGLWADYLIEVKPVGKTDGEIVWKWREWDHLIQEFDSLQDHYGVVANHPESITVNPIGWRDEMSPADLENLKSLGYVGKSNRAKPEKTNPDWTHINSISYNAEFDQIALGVRGFSEIWIVDHGTTIEEAAGHTGGRWGKGGDLLYRWGNPMAYGAGTKEDQQLFAQHDVQWIVPDLKGAGNLLAFNNGRNRLDGQYSSVVEIELPGGKEGKYPLEKGKPFGPAKPVWMYIAPVKEDFYASFLSGAQRLPNGNTLICHGMTGSIFEVTESGEMVWNYILPVHGMDSLDSGMPGYRVGLFTVRRYAPEFPGLADKDLTPGILFEDDDHE